MNNNFNLEKFNRLFRTKRFDIQNKHSKEFQDFNAEIARMNAFNSGITIKRRSEIKQKHFKDLCSICLDSLIEACAEENKISENDKNLLVTQFDNFAKGFISHEKNGLESAMLSYGHQRGAIITECQNNLVSLLSQVRVNALDNLLIKVENYNKKVEKEGSKNQEEKYLPLEDEQVNTLCLLVEAYRNVEPQKRSEFIVTRDSNSDSVLHPGFNKGWANISTVDLRMLDSVGLIKILEKDYLHIEFKFNLTPAGLKYFELIKLKEIEPIKRVEKDILQFVELEAFKSKYGNAYKKWKEAEALLWKADNKELYSTIGHLCREAVQEFLDKLITDHNLQNELPDKTKTKIRFQGIIQLKKKSQAKLSLVFIFRL